ncbi:hypothetical protein [Sphingomonas sp. SFZ2018-12]|nr:hypothetical protein [Sphingomonas sp. SFZ2018-12]
MNVEIAQAESSCRFFIIPLPSWLRSHRTYLILEDAAMLARRQAR